MEEEEGLKVACDAIVNYVYYKHKSTVSNKIEFVARIDKFSYPVILFETLEYALFGYLKT